MKKLFHMHKVTTKEKFEKAVMEMTHLQNARLFHCYVSGDIFKIATAPKVQEFDFSAFESEEEIVNYIHDAMQILRKNSKGRLLLDSI